MKFLLLVLLGSIFNTFSQEAVKIKVDTEEVTIKPSEEKKESVVKSKTYDLNNLTTQESRAITNFQASTGVGFDIEGVASHLTLAKKLSRDVWLHLRGSFPAGTDSDADFFFGEVGAKLFTGNSFYITPSFFYVSGESVSDNSASASGGGLMFTIGNEWRISKNFVIGADWLGLGYSLFESEGDMEGGIVRAMMFNVGYSF